MSDVADTVQDAVERGKESRFNGVIAALVAVTATCMALGNVKDGNVVQAMQQAQANGIDTWSYFQAKSTRQHLAESFADQLTVERDTWPGMTAESRGEIDQKISALRAKAAVYETEKAELQKRAEGYQKEYDRLNLHDDQFDMSDAALSIAIALYGISALTQKRWLLGMATGLAAFGLLFELAGFAGWSIHPDFLARLLG
jgi:hypothetical protein